MTWNATLLLLVPAWPAMLSAAALVWSRQRSGAHLALLAALPALAVGIDPPSPHVVHHYPWLLLGTRLGLSDADALVLLFSSIVWIIAASFAFGSLRHEPRSERFFTFFMLTMAGNLGAIVAQDIPSFYACYAVMSFAAYVLIAHHQTERTRRAGRVYAVLVVIGEAALALAMLLAAGQLGAIDFASLRAGMEALPARHLIIGLAVVGFGIKAGALGLHVWLPVAHPVAPAPASAVLSATIIVVGLVGLLRFLPVGAMALPGWGGLLVAMGLATCFYGALVGIDQREPKVVLAYSSVSQMGIMIMGAGMVLLEPTLSGSTILALAFFALHHGLAKSALFLGTGLGTAALSAKQRRALVIGLGLPSLALAGAPFTSGMLAKSALVASEASLAEPWASVVTSVFPFTSLATALLMTRFLVVVARQIGGAEERAGAIAWLAWGASLVAVLALPWWLRPAATIPTGALPVGTSLWPLALAGALALAANWFWRRAGRPAIPPIPEGDMLVPIEHLLLSGRTRARRIGEVAGEARDAWDSLASRAWSGIRVSFERSAEIEGLLDRWAVALELALLIGLAIAWIAA